jgi:hypothetical protein
LDSSRRARGQKNRDGRLAPGSRFRTLSRVARWQHREIDVDV